MAAHFKQPGDDRGAHARLGGNPRTRLNTRRGGEESYHAPEGNPHAASVPHRHDATYIPVVSELSDQRRGHNRRRRDHGFVETDPYDLSGRRSRDPRKRVGRVVSVLLFVVGIALIAVAAGMWIHNQWQYHEQDRINEELATYADVSDNGSTPPQVDWEALKAVNDEVVGWLQVYGHHLRNGAMFKPVSDMANQEMFDSVSTVWYVTEEATYELEPLLLYETDANDTNVRRFSFESVDELRSYLTELLGRAVTSRSDAADLIANASNVLTLCTCNYDNGDSGRTLLVCVPKSAAASADATTTSE